MPIKKNETLITPVVIQSIPIVPPIANPNAEYTKIYEGQLTNSFTTVNSKKKNHKEIQESNNDGEVKQKWLFDLNDINGGNVILSDPENNSLTMTSSQLLDIIAIKLTNTLPYKGSDQELAKHLDCVLSVEDYMRFRDITVRDEAVRQLKKDLRSLFNASTIATITYYVGKGKERKQLTEKLEIHYVDAIPKGQIKDYAHFRIGLSYARYLVHSQIMPYPLLILSASKNRNFYYVGKKLATHYNMNKRKANKESISVDSLLKYTPEIPSFEEEANRSRHYKQKCIEPLIKTLEEMVDKKFLTEWTIWHEKNTPLTEKELSEWKFTKDSGKKLYVHFKINNHPYDIENALIPDISVSESRKAVSISRK